MSVWQCTNIECSKIQCTFLNKYVTFKKYIPKCQKILYLNKIRRMLWVYKVDM